MAAGAVKVYREKVSGAKANRAELLKVVNKLEPGDVLLVTRLDRLARSTRDLLEPAGHHQRARGELPIIAGHLGRHHQRTRSPDHHGACWLGRVRA